MWEDMMSSALNMMILRCLRTIQEEYPIGNRTYVVEHGRGVGARDVDLGVMSILSSN